MTCISQKSKITPRRVLPSRAFSFRACVRASLLLFLCGSARLSAGAAKPLHTPPTLSPRRKDAATETKAHASTLAPSALCLVAKRALFPRSIPPSGRCSLRSGAPDRRGRPRSDACDRLRGSRSFAVFLFPAGLLFAIAGLFVPSRLFVPFRQSCASVRLLEGELPACRLLILSATRKPL